MVCPEKKTKKKEKKMNVPDPRPVYSTKQAYDKILNDFHRTRTTWNVSVDPDALGKLLKYIGKKLDEHRDSYIT